MKRFYKKKPVVVEAIQLTESNIGEVYEWIHGHPVINLTKVSLDWWERYCDNVIKQGMDIKTLEDGHDGRAKHVASIGDWIIKGIKGEFYPCKPDIFEATYDLAYVDSEGEDMGQDSVTYENLDAEATKKTYRLKYLKGALPGHSAEWMTAEDWAEHAKYVEELKAKGEYLKEEEVQVTIMHNPLLDGLTSPPESVTWAVAVLDFSKDEEE